jgi:hypothetical protein
VHRSQGYQCIASVVPIIVPVLSHHLLLFACCPHLFGSACSGGEGCCIVLGVLLVVIPWNHICHPFLTVVCPWSSFFCLTLSLYLPCKQGSQQWHWMLGGCLAVPRCRVVIGGGSMGRCCVPHGNHATSASCCGPAPHVCSSPS